MVYDPGSNRLIVFGGCNGGCFPILNDVWVLTNANGLGGTPQWIALPITGGSPQGRAHPTAAYDPATNQMIVFGGQNGAGTIAGNTFAEVWALSNASGAQAGPSQWRLLGPTGIFPEGQYGASAVWVGANRMVVFGGFAASSGAPTNAVNLLINANSFTSAPSWVTLTPNGAPGSPSMRGFASASYDPTAARLFIGGGCTATSCSANDVWTLSNASGLLGSAPTFTQTVVAGGPSNISGGLHLDASATRLTAFENPPGAASGRNTWLLSGVPAPPPMPAVTFASTDFAGGAGSTALVAGDFNGDGRPDLAVANVTAGTVSIVLSTGPGVFGPPVTFAAGPGPSSIAAGDLNRDGNLDLVVGDAGGSGTVAILLGDGVGGFGAAPTVDVSGGVLAVALADVNGDGKLDLIAATASSVVGVRLGNGDGTFGPLVNLAVPGRPESVALADLNGDGRLDLVVALSNMNQVAVAPGNGAGGFGPITVYAVGFNPRDAAVADLNGDGKPDLIVANAGTGSGGSVSVLLGNGDGSFGSAMLFGSAGSFPVAVAVADVNGDGKPDVLLADEGNNAVVVLLGTGTGTLTPGTLFAVGVNPESVAVADFNGDGRPDIVTANVTSNNVSLLSNTTAFTPAGTLLKAGSFPAGNDPRGIDAGDLNRDGIPDVAVVNSSSDTVSILLGDGLGGFTSKMDFATGSVPSSVVLGDFNGDGKLDVAVGNAFAGTVSVLLGDGLGKLGARTDFAVGGRPEGLAVADFNGDGRLDLAVANFGLDTVSILLGDGAGGFLPKTDFATGDGPVSVAVGDVNGDGKLDLVVANTFANTITVRLGNGAGGFGPAATLTVGNRPAFVALADLDGDGALDIVVTNVADDTVSVLLGDGAGAFGAPTNYAAGDGPTGAVIADFDRDGTLDLAITNEGGGTVTVLYGDGLGGFPRRADVSGIPTAYVAVAADFNRDGRVDVAVARSGALGGVTMLLNGQAQADLSVSKTLVPSPATLGATLTYTITVKNTGPSPATGVTMDDPLPASLRFVSAATTQGTCATPLVGGTGTVSCNLGTLAVAGIATVTIVATPTAAGVFTNVATVHANELDPSPGDNAAGVTTVVNAADLIVSALTHVPAGPTTTDLVTFSATVSNVGTASAPASTLEFRIGGETSGTSQVRFPIGALAPGASQTVQRQAVLTVAQGYINTAIADVDNVVVESNETNNQTTDVYVVTASTAAVLTGTVRRGDTGGVVPGATVSVYDGTLQGQAAATPLITGMADANGVYRFTVAPGTYKVQARLEGLVTTYFNGQIAFNSATPIVVVVGQIFTANMTMAAGAGGISGRVIDAVSGAGVVANVIIGDQNCGFVENIITNPDGSFSSQTLGQGQYKAFVPRSGYALVWYDNKPSCGTADVITVTSGVTTPNINFALAVPGSISGHVTSGGSGVAGAIVDFFDATTNQGVGFSVTTDATGGYTAGGALPTMANGFLAGTYKVRARKAGLVDKFYVNGVDPASATAVTVNAGGTTPNIDIALAAGGTIQGLVLDRITRAPLQNANVLVFRPNANTFSFITNARTGADGRYTLGGLRDGLWIARVECFPGNGCQTNNLSVTTSYVVSYWSGLPDNPATDSGMASTLPISGGNTVTADINPATGGGRIQGRIIRRDNGQPVPAGTGVQALWGQFARNAFVVQTSTDANGNYSLTGLTPGPYVIQVLANPAAGIAPGWYPTGATNAGSALPIVVAAGQTVTGKDFQVYAGMLSSVKGVVRDAQGQPVSATNVNAVDPLTNFGIRGVNVNGDGSYEINALPPGSYVVRLQPHLGLEAKVYDGEKLPVAGKILSLDAGVVLSNIDFSLGVGGTVTGRVVESGTGFPIAGAGVNLRNYADNTTVGTIATQRDGTFVFRGVPAGLYKARAMEPAHVTTWHAGAALGKRTIDEATFITVTGGQTTPNVDITMDPGGATLSGRVFVAPPQGDAAPLIDAVVQLRDAVSGFGVTNIITRADGSFEVPGVGSGDYKVRILSARTANEWFQDADSREAATVVQVVAPGQITLTDAFVSDQFGTIAGRVTRLVGGVVTPVPDAAIAIFDAAGNFVSGTGVTDHDGQYSMKLRNGLAPGQYVVQARALGFASQYFVAADVGTPVFAAAAQLPVAATGPEPLLNATSFRLTLSSDLTGQVAYAGVKQGPLVVELFTDAMMTQRAYRLSFASPVFPRPFGFMSPAPDTRGIVPGTYWVRAFIDVSPNGTLDGGEPSGTAGPFIVTEGNTTAGANVTIMDQGGGANLPPVAFAQTVTTSKGAPVKIVLGASDTETAAPNLIFNVQPETANGGSVSGIGAFRTYTPLPGFTGTDTFTFTVTDRGNPDNCNIEIPPCALPATSAPATVTVVVNPAATFSFATSIEVIAAPPAGGQPSAPQFLGDIEIDEAANGALVPMGSVTVTLPAGLTFAGTPSVSTMLSNGLTLTAPSATAGQLTFFVGNRSTLGPAKILVSNIAVVVAPGFVSPLVPSVPVNVAIGGSNAGITPATVQNGEAVGQGATPVLTKVEPAQVAQGAAGYVVLLTGVNFAANASVSFGGTGISVVATNASSTEILATLNVGSAAALGFRDVTVTNGPSKSSTLPNGVEITPPPTVLATDRGSDTPLRRGLATQRVNVTGTGFRTPTTSPPNLFVEFSTGLPFVADGAIITEAVGYTSAATVWADVTVSVNSSLGTRYVRVTNPDGGVGTSLAAIVSVADPTSDTPPTLNNPPSKDTTVALPTPTITGFTTLGGTPITGALLGASISIAGTNFSATPASNLVTFAGASATRVSATATAATTTVLTVTVPSQAVDGNVTVSVGGQLSAGVAFTVTSPRLSSVIPSTGEQGRVAPVQLTGSKFANGANVSVTSVGLPVAGLTISNVAVSPNTITATFTLSPNVAIGVYDVTVQNPNGGVATLPAGFEVRRPSTVMIALTGYADVRDYLPSVGSVSVTLNSSGVCMAKSIAAASVPLVVTFTGAGTPPPLRVQLESSALPGTAFNEDCEPTGVPGPDFTIGDTDDGQRQSVDFLDGAVIHTTMLHSRDMGGNVTIRVIDLSNNNELGVLRLPVDSDGDGLPDTWELAAGLNPNNADEDGNGVMDDDDKFVRDALTNFEKYRGAWMMGPSAGNAGSMSRHVRLEARQRNLFVRGQGFGNDLAVTGLACGWNPNTGRPVSDTTILPSNPCPLFDFGGAFQEQGIKVHDATRSFTPVVTGSGPYGLTSQLPRKSMVDGTRSLLDMVTVVYDAVGCNSTENCDQTSKGGVRQWGFSTLGATTGGVAYGGTGYGAPKLFKRAIQAYFLNRPYEHRLNDPTRIVIGSNGKPNLAPITLVGDANDNGIADRREGVVNGELAGDTYIAGVFNMHLSAMDVNDDGCVERPLVGDPTTLLACEPTASSATYPQATKQQVIRHVITHEIGHAIGVPQHTPETDCVMFGESSNWIRENHFGPTAAPALQIMNKGGQQ